MMLIGVIVLSFKAGGSTSHDTIVALVMVLIWMVVGLVWFIHNTRKQRHEILPANHRRFIENDDWSDDV